MKPGTPAKITEQSSLSLSLVLSLICSGIGGVLWLTNIHSKASQALDATGAVSEELKDYKTEHRQELKEMRKLLEEILQRVSKVEERTRG